MTDPITLLPGLHVARAMDAEEAGDKASAARHYREAARVHTDPERARVYLAEAERLEA